jgi:hypothetical protein
MPLAFTNSRASIACGPFSRMASNTGARSPDEELIICKTSAIAASRASDDPVRFDFIGGTRGASDILYWLREGLKAAGYET